MEFKEDIQASIRRQFQNTSRQKPYAENFIPNSCLKNSPYSQLDSMTVSGFLVTAFSPQPHRKRQNLCNFALDPSLACHNKQSSAPLDSQGALRLFPGDSVWSWVHRSAHCPVQDSNRSSQHAPSSVAKRWRTACFVRNSNLSVARARMSFLSTEDTLPLDRLVPHQERISKLRPWVGWHLGLHCG